MPNTFTEKTVTGYGTRISKSIGGVLLGIILFLASFFVLYFNEGRFDLSLLAKTALEIEASSLNTDPNLDGQFVYATGNVTSDQIIGDNLFLKPSRFMVIERKVEMYAWKEIKHTKTESNLGGSETETTTYNYETDWQENPSASSNFKYPEGHENPQKTLESLDTKINSATIGVYKFDAKKAELPKTEPLFLTTENTVLSQGAILGNDTYVFIKKGENGTLETPEVGDLRISYKVLVPDFNGTIFGQLDGEQITSYTDENGHALFRVFSGSREAGIAALHSEYTSKLWLFRLIGFLMMWFGLMIAFGPISIILDILPIFGNISKMLTAVLTLIVSLILSAATIAVSILAHSLLALVITAVVLILAIIVFFKFWKRQKISA